MCFFHWQIQADYGYRLMGTVNWTIILIPSSIHRWRINLLKEVCINLFRLVTICLKAVLSACQAAQISDVNNCLPKQIVPVGQNVCVFHQLTGNLFCHTLLLISSIMHSCCLKVWSKLQRYGTEWGARAGWKVLFILWFRWGEGVLPCTLDICFVPS